MQLAEELAAGYFAFLSLYHSTEGLQASPAWLNWDLASPLTVVGKLLRLRRIKDCYESEVQIRNGRSIRLLVDRQEFVPSFVAPFNNLMRLAQPAIFHNLFPVIFEEELCLAFQPQQTLILNASEDFVREELVPVEQLFEQGSVLELDFSQTLGLNPKKAVREGVLLEEVKRLMANRTIRMGLFGVPEISRDRLVLNLRPYSAKTAALYSTGYERVVVLLRRGREQAAKVVARCQEQRCCLMLTRARMVMTQHLDLIFEAGSTRLVPAQGLFNPGSVVIRVRRTPLAGFPGLNRLPMVVRLRKVAAKFMIAEARCAQCGCGMIGPNSCENKFNHEARLRLLSSIVCEVNGGVAEVLMKGKAALQWHEAELEGLLPGLLNDCISYGKVKFVKQKNEFRAQANGQDLPRTEQRSLIGQRVGSHLTTHFVVAVQYCDLLLEKWQLQREEKAELATTIETEGEFMGRRHINPNGVVVRQEQPSLVPCLRVLQVLPQDDLIDSYAQDLLLA